MESLGPAMHAQITGLQSQVVPQEDLMNQGPQIEHDVLFKIVIIGDTGVGKTCISIRYYSGKFSEAHEPTIGGSFMTKDVELDQHIVKFEMWDTAGQERYRSLAQMYYK